MEILQSIIHVSLKKNSKKALLWPFSIVVWPERDLLYTIINCCLPPLTEQHRQQTDSLNKTLTSR